MRRDIRKNKVQDDELNIKIIKYSAIGISILAIIVFGLLIYSENLNDEVKEGVLTEQQISSILNNSNNLENTESASTEIGKTVNEVETESKNNAILNNSNIKTEKATSNNVVTNSEKKIPNANNNVLNTDKVTSNSTNTINNTNQNVNKTKETSTSETTIELNFEPPVKGDIVRDFAVDSLIYSETLKEWTTHTGIDIKADKTAVVNSAEAGTVKTIKNDPRYGLTIVVEHQNGFQTVYSNLLTSEFVIEGEKVEKGQALGTVGNTAAFEITDEPHLHFEILKDSVQVNPSIYLK